MKGPFRALVRRHPETGVIGWACRGDDGNALCPCSAQFDPRFTLAIAADYARMHLRLCHYPDRGGNLTGRVTE